MTLDQLVPGASVTVGDRTGEVDRLGSDGVVYVWFGAVRDLDQARILESLDVNVVLGIPAQLAALQPLKDARASEVDAKTEEIISHGFEYPPGSGQFFSLSLAAQSNLTNTLINRTSPGFSFPVKWATKAQIVIPIPDANTFVQFYGIALSTVRAARDSGTILKELIGAAQTEAELASIVDTR